MANKLKQPVIIEKYLANTYTGTRYLFYSLVIFLVYAGWQNRHMEVINAEYGTGYALGIVGGSMMLMLLLYPLRKRMKFMRNWGPIRYWFKTHMLFGILGPIAILYHSNFSLGSFNSNMALYSMLVVAISGLFGRYFYARIHYGIYGSKTSLDELKSDSNEIKEMLHRNLAIFPDLMEATARIEELATTRPSSLVAQIFSHLYIRSRIWLSKRNIYAQLRRAIKTWNPPADTDNGTVNRKELQEASIQYINAYLRCIRKSSEFRLYERLFSIWHIIHFPLFLLLVLSGTIHVFAVHLY